MRKLPRRQFVRGAAGTGAALAINRAPAFAQRRELTMLSGSHFVPPSDEELRRQGEAFAKQAGITFKLDTIQGSSCRPSVRQRRRANSATTSCS